MNTKAVLAVFKRTLPPTLGAQRICFYLCLPPFQRTGRFLAAEFFDSNLANLDQLNRFFSYPTRVYSCNHHEYLGG